MGLLFLDIDEYDMDEGTESDNHLVSTDVDRLQYPDLWDTIDADCRRGSGSVAWYLAFELLGGTVGRGGFTVMIEGIDATVIDGGGIPTSLLASGCQQCKWCQTTEDEYSVYSPTHRWLEPTATMLEQTITRRHRRDTIPLQACLP